MNGFGGCCREASTCQPVNDPEAKLKAVRKAARYSFPADISDEVFPIEQRDVMRAAEIVQNPAQFIGARCDPHRRNGKARRALHFHVRRGLRPLAGA